MKKLSLICALLLTLTIYSQDDPVVQSKYEIKGNAFNLLVFKAPEVSFEYLINEDSSVGASILVNLEDADEDNYNSSPYYVEQFAFTPYYRRFFSGKYAERFFLETFAMFNKQEDVIYDYDYNTNIETTTYTEESSTNLAFGIAIGSKFTSPGGFMFEFYGGVGRNIITSNEIESFEFVPRLGVSLGYRF